MEKLRTVGTKTDLNARTLKVKQEDSQVLSRWFRACGIWKDSGEWREFSWVTAQNGVSDVNLCSTVFETGV
jgi:hypothetical protein